MSTNNTEEPPFFVSGSGRVVRQTGPASAEPVATDLMFPVALAFGPDGGLHVALPALGANAGEGTILRLEVAAAQAGTRVAGAPSAAAPPAPCGPLVAATPTA
jgi:hypothetical protein